VIFPRQGLVAFPPTVLRNLDGEQIAGHTAAKHRDWPLDGLFVDSTGGWGWDAISAMRRLGLEPVGIEFSGKALNPLYFNKRTEMHFDLAAWVKQGGALPPIPDLVAELTTPTYSFKGDKMLLEPKDSIKERLGRSPDLADGAALTFAYPVLPNFSTGHPALDAAVARQCHRHDYDPLGG
jgi:hypothetical protein